MASTQIKIVNSGNQTVKVYFTNTANFSATGSPLTIPAGQTGTTTITALENNAGVHNETMVFTNYDDPQIVVKNLSLSSNIVLSPIPTLNLRAWYGDVVNNGINRTTLANAASITQWDDQSGNGFNINTKTGTVNYEQFTNSINLSGGALYNTVHNILSGNVSRTIFTVGFAGSVGVTQEFMFLGNAGGNGIAWFPQPSAAAMRVDCNATYNQFNTTNTANVTTLYTTKFSGTTVAHISARKNGADLSVQSTNINGQVVNTSPAIMVGGYLVNGSPTVRGNMRMKEIIIYNRLLSPAEITQVETYLNNKYSIF
jgi:hypothetical protein